MPKEAETTTEEKALSAEGKEGGTTPEGTTAAGAGNTVNFQAEIGCVLLNKELKALMQKKDNQTFYAIIPKLEEGQEDGMAFVDAVNEIGEFVKGLTKMEKNPISAETVENLLSSVLSDPKALKVRLRQAYLFIKQGTTENFTEYAFNITVEYDPKKDGEAQQSAGTLFKVSKLAFTVWSCDRELILKQMDLYDLGDIDKLLASQLNSLEQQEVLLIENK